MKMSRFLVLILVMALAIVLLPTAARAQDTMEPSVTVSDQVVTNSWVTIASVYYNAPGFIVIHADSDGSIGPVIGYRQLSVGLNTNVEVWIDAAQATSTLYAMLHADTGTAGVYEFGTVDGADGPVSDSAGNVVTPPFHVTVLNVKDQLPGDTYTRCFRDGRRGFMVGHPQRSRWCARPGLGPDLCRSGHHHECRSGDCCGRPHR